MDLFKRLNLVRPSEIALLNVPETFPDPAQEGHTVHSDLGRVERISFALVFATTCEEVEHYTERLIPKLGPDAVVWFAYPKKTSRLHPSDLSRDRGWEPPGRAGFEPVRQVAIDQDWSALRFRQVGFIKKLSRRKALSDEGRKRIGEDRR